MEPIIKGFGYLAGIGILAVLVGLLTLGYAVIVENLTIGLSGLKCMLVGGILFVVFGFLNSILDE